MTPQIAHAPPSTVRWNFQDMTTRILIIDEDHSLRECLELEFAAERHQLVAANSAEEAFQRDPHRQPTRDRPAR